MVLNEHSGIYRRAFLKKAFASLAVGVTGTIATHASPFIDPDTIENKQKLADWEDNSNLSYKDKISITKLETFKVKPSFFF